VVENKENNFEKRVTRENRPKSTTEIFKKPTVIRRESCPGNMILPINVLRKMGAHPLTTSSVIIPQSNNIQAKTKNYFWRLSHASDSKTKKRAVKSGGSTANTSPNGSRPIGGWVCDNTVTGSGSIF
jgi:hypothetical protein